MYMLYPCTRKFTFVSIQKHNLSHTQSNSESKLAELDYFFHIYTYHMYLLWLKNYKTHKHLAVQLLTCLSSAFPVF